MAGARLARNLPGALRIAILLSCAGLLGTLAQAGSGPTVHREGARCTTCHSADAAVLRRDPAGARYRLRSDLEAVCLRCHGGEGPSHPTGMAARGRVPPVLPLGRERRVECYTCHVMHGESGHFEDYTRLDNRRGGLCLSCHTLAELEK